MTTLAVKSFFSPVFAAVTIDLGNRPVVIAVAVAQRRINHDGEVVVQIAKIQNLRGTAVGDEVRPLVPSQSSSLVLFSCGFRP